MKASTFPSWSASFLAVSNLLVIDRVVCRESSDSICELVVDPEPMTDGMNEEVTEVTSLLQVVLSPQSPDSHTEGLHGGNLDHELAHGEPLDGEVPSKGQQPIDWFWGSSNPLSCNHPQWDLTDRSWQARILLPAMLAILTGFVFVYGKLKDDSAPVSDRVDASTLRRYDLDYARIAAVTCVVAEHSERCVSCVAMGASISLHY